MKKQSRGLIFLWALIAATVAGGTFLICEHLGAGTASAVRPDVDVSPDDATDNSGDVSAPAAAAALQTFSNDGYSLSVPASWNIERTGSDTIAIHSDPASPDVACKIEVSAFTYSSDVNMADWIGHRIGADPSLAVVERSSEDVSIDGGTGVKWTGTIDGISTTLVYAFGDARAYEIAPSVIGEGADGSAPCDDMLQTFLSGLTI